MYIDQSRAILADLYSRGKLHRKRGRPVVDGVCMGPWSPSCSCGRESAVPPNSPRVHASARASSLRAKRAAARTPAPLAAASAAQPLAAASAAQPLAAASAAQIRHDRNEPPDRGAAGVGAAGLHPLVHLPEERVLAAMRFTRRHVVGPWGDWGYGDGEVGEPAPVAAVGVLLDSGVAVDCRTNPQDGEGGVRPATIKAPVEKKEPERRRNPRWFEYSDDSSDRSAADFAERSGAREVAERSDAREPTARRSRTSRDSDIPALDEVAVGSMQAPAPMQAPVTKH